MVDMTSGHDLLSLMDTFFGYNQIWMAVEDEDKTTFIIDQGHLLLQDHTIWFNECRCYLSMLAEQDF